jgi:hypothetical protein
MEEFADLVKVHDLSYKYPTKYKKVIPSGYKEISKYTDADSMVFQNKKTKDLVFAMRGLDPSSIRDLEIGFNIIMGDVINTKALLNDKTKYGSILKNEDMKLKELQSEFPNKKIVLAGHSRGGRKAIDLGNRNNLEYKAFNPGDASSARRIILPAAVDALGAAMGIESKAALALARASLSGVMGSSQQEQTTMQKANIFLKDYIDNFISSNIVDRSMYLQGGVLPTQGISKNLLPKQLQFKMSDNQIQGLFDSNIVTPFSGAAISAASAGDISESSRLSNLPSREANLKNVWVTENDIVSHSFQGGVMSSGFSDRPNIVKPKEYVKSFGDTLLGNHALAHFMSKELYDNIQNIDDLPMPRIDVDETPSFMSPNIDAGYSVNTAQLCRRYGKRYSDRCDGI